MHIKLTQPGWETFTGSFGGVNFKDGRSVAEVNPALARQLGNILSIETEDGKNPSASQQVIELQSMKAADPVEKNVEASAADQKPAAVGKVYSREELEAIASKEGLPGLRKIAEGTGIKASSIVKMIEELLKFYKGEQQKAPEVPEAHEASQAE